MGSADLMARYEAFLATKSVSAPLAGYEDVPALHGDLFPHQRATAEFLLRVGRGAGFLDTGLGKTFVALEWGRVVAERSGRPVMMLAPLAVAQQHAREAARFGIEARVVRSPDQVGPGINITNYELVDRFDNGAFGGVVLDESSIIKSFTGATTRQLMRLYNGTAMRLACTATPAPNDHMELGQHAQFLGAMDSSEMLSRWFIADQKNMGRYRLKRHAVKSFWSWVASWARCVSKPSDLGFSDEGFELPELKLDRVMMRADRSVDAGSDGDQARLFRIPDTSATAIHREKRLTAEARAIAIAEAVNDDHREPWSVWCDTDYEADALMARIPDAVEVRGSMSPDLKERNLLAFSDGSARVIVTKPSIAGFGLNWQHCARTAFVGLSFSYEMFYQAIRRHHRFGQRRPVKALIAMADTERAIWDVISRKAGDHDAMKAEMIGAMHRAVETRETKIDYQPTVPMQLPAWLRSAA